MATSFIRGNDGARIRLDFRFRLQGEWASFCREHMVRRGARSRIPRGMAPVWSSRRGRRGGWSKRLGLFVGGGEPLAQALAQLPVRNHQYGSIGGLGSQARQLEGSLEGRLVDADLVRLVVDLGAQGLALLFARSEGLGGTLAGLALEMELFLQVGQAGVLVGQSGLALADLALEFVVGGPGVGEVDFEDGALVAEEGFVVHDLFDAVPEGCFWGFPWRCAGGCAGGCLWGYPWNLLWGPVSLLLPLPHEPDGLVLGSARRWCFGRAASPRAGPA